MTRPRTEIEPAASAGDAAGFRSLATERLRIRRFRPDDAEAFAAYRSDPEVARYQGWQAPYPLAEARGFIAGLEKLEPGMPGRWFQFAVALAESDTLIGDCALYADPDAAGRAELGFSLARAHQGRGHAAEAVAAVLDHGFARLGLQQLHAITDARNAPAARLLLRLGFREAEPAEASPAERLFACTAAEWSARPLPPPLEVREERVADRAAVGALVAEAFGQESEAALVVRLREEAAPLLSLVAFRGGELAGHVLLSPARLEGPSTPPCAGLGPLAVAPAHQKTGIGGRLMRAALERAPALGWRAVFLVGDPRYYARFGFRPAAPAFRYVNPVMDPAFQQVELEPAALKGQGGVVRFHPAFDEAEA